MERLLNQVWKFYDYSPKKTAKLVMVQMELLKLLPTEQMVQAKKRVKKAKKAAATRWLSHKASVESMKQEFVNQIRESSVEDSSRTKSAIETECSFPPEDLCKLLSGVVQRSKS